MSATETRYAFDNNAPVAETQLNTLESFLDPITAVRLCAPIVTAGMYCWEVGAGGGSVAHQLARAVGPTGHVVATDIEPSRIPPAANVSVLRHDVRVDPPPGGLFDVIHARLVLLHLPERKHVLRRLIRSLAPGGWLVIEEFDCSTPLRVLTTPTDAAGKLFQQVVDGILTILQARGADLMWAQNVHAEMAFAGLADIDTMTYSESWVGGTPNAGLHAINSRQLEPELLAAGIDAEELHTFRELSRDPRFAALSYQVVSTRGRQPAHQ
jgi:SAM-dependent methyltransferase